MVSLFEISQRKPLWAHVATGVPTLDQMLNFQGDGILDMQSVPCNNGAMAILANMMASHLLHSPSLRVVVLECTNPFEMEFVRRNPQYDQWIEQERVQRYTTSTFGRLYAFFAFMPLQPGPPGSTLFVVLNFHESLEHYQLQLAATHEERLLKHQIERNSCILENAEKIAAEGIELVSLPKIPPSSALLRDNPYVKANQHHNALYLLMAEYAFTHSALFVLFGHLEPKYKPVQTDPPQLSPQPDTSFSSQRPPKVPRQLVLAPLTFGTRQNDVAFSESKITARIVLYLDWYYKSPHFRREGRVPDAEDYYPVYAAKYSSMKFGNINEPVYFDFMRAEAGQCFVDLLGTETGGLSELIQTSISSTQTRPRDSGVSRNAIALSSSPPITSTQILQQTKLAESKRSEESGDSFESEEEGDAFSTASASERLFIEGSDVELTGTILEDDDWLVRHT